jgi:hypothetical protein
LLSAYPEKAFLHIPVAICPHLVPETKRGGLLDTKDEAISDDTHLVFHQVQLLQASLPKRGP